MSNSNSNAGDSSNDKLSVAERIKLQIHDLIMEKDRYRQQQTQDVKHALWVVSVSVALWVVLMRELTALSEQIVALSGEIIALNGAIVLGLSLFVWVFGWSFIGRMKKIQKIDSLLQTNFEFGIATKRKEPNEGDMTIPYRDDARVFLYVALGLFGVGLAFIFVGAVFGWPSNLTKFRYISWVVGVIYVAHVGFSFAGYCVGNNKKCVMCEHIKGWFCKQKNKIMCKCWENVIDKMKICKGESKSPDLSATKNASKATGENDT